MMYRQISYKNGRNPSFSLHLCRRAGGFLRADLVVRQSVHRGGVRGGLGWREKVSPEQSPGTPPRDFGYCRKMGAPGKRPCGEGAKERVPRGRILGSLKDLRRLEEGEKERLPRLRKTRGRVKRKGSPSKRWETLEEAATYSPTYECSTIGADRFNFSVRNGKRWDPVAIAT